jgi:hypothetical protein
MTAITSIMVILVVSLGIGLMAQDSYAQGKQYKVKVTFDSITILDDREGLLSGDGEFDLSAFVQGKRVDLTRASGPGAGIWDAQEGKTYQFNPGTEVTVLLPEKVPLSILITGHEVDGCGRVDWPKDDDPIMQRLVDILNKPRQTPTSSADFPRLQPNDNLPAVIANQLSCSGNDNDYLGGLVGGYYGGIYYGAPDYGAGSHEETVESFVGSLLLAPSSEEVASYTLRYTISASPTIASRLPLGDIPKFGLESTCNNNLPVSSATSSGDLPTFTPANAIDNNPNTIWWSTIIVNPFITLDLGTSKSVCGVDIAYADGNSHPYKFDVSVSTDGTSFTNVLSATSTGTTTSPEKYNFPPTQARYVKITITESTAGATRSIAEISEIDVFG